jgi:Xaa-Pro aminopeptidase
MRIHEIQEALRNLGLDGWLFFDHHRRDPLAYRVLQFEPAQQVTRRWYYLVPANGEPRGLVHKIEAGVLAPLPGEKRTYAGWSNQAEELRGLLAGLSRVAMQYSPKCAVPYVSNIDAGTMELVRDCGVEVVTSADLIQHFEARWSPAQYESHKHAGQLVDAIRKAAFHEVSTALRGGRTLTEFEVQQFIMLQFANHGMVTDHGPIVAVNANASNPHYSPSPDSSSPIRAGDLLLIDLWAKLAKPGSVYYDITWMGYCGTVAPDRMKNVFAAVTGARDAGIGVATSSGDLMGYQVDDATRGHLKALGLAEYFFHRTGHSLGEEVHGNGANMDNFETHDERRIIADTCFSIEPGVYLPEFGVRSEVNIFRTAAGGEVTGEIQKELISLL